VEIVTDGSLKGWSMQQREVDIDVIEKQLDQMHQ
jgi:hypothetical protein